MKLRLTQDLGFREFRSVSFFKKMLFRSKICIIRQIASLMPSHRNLNTLDSESRGEKRLFAYLNLMSISLNSVIFAI